MFLETKSPYSIFMCEVSLLPEGFTATRQTFGLFPLLDYNTFHLFCLKADLLPLVLQVHRDRSRSVTYWVWNLLINSWCSCCRKTCPNDYYITVFVESICLRWWDIVNLSRFVVFMWEVNLLCKVDKLRYDYAIERPAAWSSTEKTSKHKSGGKTLLFGDTYELPVRRSTIFICLLGSFFCLSVAPNLKIYIFWLKCIVLSVCV